MVAAAHSEPGMRAGSGRASLRLTPSLRPAPDIPVSKRTAAPCIRKPRRGRIPPRCWKGRWRSKGWNRCAPRDRAQRPDAARRGSPTGCAAPRSIRAHDGTCPGTLSRLAARDTRAGAPAASRASPRSPLHHTPHECAGSCAEPGAPPLASLAALVQALLRSPPALRPALPRAVRSAMPSAQTPRRLPSAGVPGVDLTDPPCIVNPALTRPGGPSDSHPTHR